jgi:TPR repeat protein
MSPLDILFQRADKAWEAGNLKSAFRLFLRAAKAGDIGCQVNLGTFYSDGIGMKPNRAKGMRWYMRAYRKGERCAAHNIGCVYRIENDLNQALAWFERAICLGDTDANLDVAKIHLKRGENQKAIRHLKRVIKAKPYSEVTANSWEEAQRILRRLERTRR